MSDWQSAQLVKSNLTGTVQVKVGSGRAVMIGIVTAGPTALHDSATVGGINADNQIFTCPAASVGQILVDMPFYAGLVIVAGAGNALLGYT